MEVLETSRLYFLMIVLGILPHEIWRVAGLIIGRRISEDSLSFQWLRAIATGVLAAVISQMVLMPSGQLAAVPSVVRLTSLGLGFLVYVRTASVLAGTAAGMGTLLAGNTGWF